MKYQSYIVRLETHQLDVIVTKMLCFFARNVTEWNYRVNSVFKMADVTTFQEWTYSDPKTYKQIISVFCIEPIGCFTCWVNTKWTNHSWNKFLILNQIKDLYQNGQIIQGWPQCIAKLLTVMIVLLVPYQFEPLSSSFRSGCKMFLLL